MAPERRSRAVVLTALLVVLALVAMYQWWPRPSANGGATSNERAPRQASARRGQSGVEAPVVHLPALEDQRPKPQAGERNLFRFRVKTAPAPAPSTGVAPPPAPPPTAPGTGIAPITLRFIGIIDRGGGQPKIAALVDPTGHAINCLEGGDCDGRYHIWRVGAESVDISYLDGTGRRTIRLGGG